MGSVNTASQNATKPPSGNETKQDDPAIADTSPGATAAASTEPPIQSLPKHGIFTKPWLVFQMIWNKDVRYNYSLTAATGWCVSIIIVGLLFLILGLAGTYPSSVNDQKEDDIYAINVINYILYIGAGITGILACTLGRKALRAHKSVTFHWGLLILTQILALITIILTIYVSSNQNGKKWWSTLIQVAIIIQRLFFMAALTSAQRSLRHSRSDPAVAHIVCGAHWDTPDTFFDELKDAEKGNTSK